VTEQPIVIEGQCTWQDYYAATRLHQRRPGTRWLIVGAAALAVLLMASGARTPSAFAISILVGTLMFIGLFQLQRWLTRVQCRKIYAQQTSLQLPYRLVVSAGTITCSSERGSTMFKLHEMVRWAEDSTLFLLYTSDVMFLMVPKRSFATPADEDRLRTLLLGAFPR
jgi:hypothetical protein